MSASDKLVEPAEGGKGEKRGAEDAELDKVHSANNWEEANLGDDDRRQKFLRLMGANKKEHHGRFVIGEKDSKHGRSEEETSMLNRDLERQYRTGLDLKLSGGARQHKGLGFQGEEPGKAEVGSSSSAPVPAEQNKTEDKGDSVEKDSKPEVSQGKESNPEVTKPEKPKSDEANGKEKDSDTKPPGVQMNFVKASS